MMTNNNYKDHDKQLSMIRQDYAQLSIFTANICSNLLPTCRAITDLVIELNEENNINERNKKLGQVMHAVQGIEHYFSCLIDFAHMVKQRPPSILTHINFPKILKRLYNSMSIALRVKKLKLTISYSDKLPDILLGDYFRVEYILLGLLSNAIKFTLNGEITVTLTKAKQEGDNLLMKLIVRDTGEGICSNDREMIFQPFYCVKPKFNKSYVSAGLGLTFIKQFLEDIGGEIEIKDNQQNCGAEFICLLPVKVC
ncbi:MAG: HAMP domain-containing sensor histidine kinase [Gammaproteobacteria bacterium]|jgi:signal transduction histidine kinase